MSGSDEPVITSAEGRLGRVRLNRPRAVNALTLEMVQMISEGLDTLDSDPAVSAVLLEGEGDRGFCAGGDIRALRESALGNGSLARRFWRAEYRLNARIARSVKPIIAIMDGIVMGGGIGLAGHATHRVVTERVQAAMPEVGIGFYPDVGGTWLLARAPGRLGEHLALTGSPIGVADTLRCGLADAHVPVAHIPGMIISLAAGADPAAAISQHAVEPDEQGKLAGARKWIDSVYKAETVEEILDALDGQKSKAAADAAAVIRTRSPTSLVVTLQALRSAREMNSLEDVLNQDYRVACAFLATPDFVEGIRAAVVDKDRNPRWCPPDLLTITPEEIERYFGRLAVGELGLSPAVI